MVSHGRGGPGFLLFLATCRANPTSPALATTAGSLWTLTRPASGAMSTLRQVRNCCVPEYSILCTRFLVLCLNLSQPLCEQARHFVPRLEVLVYPGVTGFDWATGSGDNLAKPDHAFGHPAPDVHYQYCHAFQRNLDGGNALPPSKQADGLQGLL